MSDLKEYIVTLKDRNDLDGFYEDMETPGGDLYIPNRAVECANRRAISRNTHYYLSDEEAMQVSRDPRVLSVDVTPDQRGLIAAPSYTQTETTWSKSTSQTSTHKNWGLLRVYEGQQRSNWGSNGTPSQSGTIIINAEGRNVDVVIVDGHINPDHPEYAVNSDGTGGSRVIQYNWFQHNARVWPGNPNSTYVYTPYDNGSTSLTTSNNHGSHVAGTVAGNTQGWARQANIYNISPYSDNPNDFNTLFLMDYIREFHRTKPVNPVTKRRNPTICNHSWGYKYDLPITDITAVLYRGTSYDGPFTETQLNSYGIITYTSLGVVHAAIPARYPALDADLVDAMEDGIINVGAAGNDYTKIDVFGGVDYDNAFYLDQYYDNQHRGSSPGSADGMICVGSISNLTSDAKSTFSNTGARVDVFAPGAYIMSSVNSTTSFGGTSDPRNSAYKIVKISGTSMASPQVCGLLASVLEIYPSMSQAQAQQYVTTLAKTGQITNTSGGYLDGYDLQGAANRYLAFRQERRRTGNLYPRRNHLIKPQAGVMFPRLGKRRYG